MSGDAKRSALALPAMVGLLGIALGAGGAIAARSSTVAPPASKPCCARGHGAPATCPYRAHLEADDPKEALRVRRALRDGIFLPWIELGRAPTPSEFARRLSLGSDEADRTLDQLQACGEAVEVGILRVPGSELIAVAWPFANVPTGIAVTVEGGRPVYARCAIDALGVSQLLGRRATVEAEARDDGSHLRVVVNGAALVSAEPPGVAVVMGEGCDNMSFFSSRSAAEAWQKDHRGQGELLTIEEAVARGAKIFGALTAGL